MELYQLRSFVAVAELGHLTRAAEKLHISQPALSAQIRALEEALAVPLFDRTSAGMMLTQGGKRLLIEAERVLAAAQAMRNEARAIKGEVAGTVRVGTVSEPDFIRVAPFMAATVRRFPLVEIEFSHVVTGEAFQLVKDGELDASFYYGNQADPSVCSITLREMFFRIAAPAAWKDRVENADWPQLATQRWVIPPTTSVHNPLVLGLFREHGVKPVRTLNADNEGVISSLVISGLGMALMREEKALERAKNGEVVLYKNVRVPTALQFIYPSERQDDPLIRALVDGIREVWKLS